MATGTNQYEVTREATMGILMSMDKTIGPDFEKGLARLSDAAQK